MFQFLDRLRQKPKAVREQYALFGAVFITLCIGIVWLVQLQHHLSTDAFSADTNEIEETRGAFSQFMTEFRERTGEIADNFRGAQEYLASEVSTSSPTSTDAVSDFESAFIIDPTKIELTVPTTSALFAGTTTPEDTGFIE